MSEVCERGLMMRKIKLILFKIRFMSNLVRACQISFSKARREPLSYWISPQ